MEAILVSKAMVPSCTSFCNHLNYGVCACGCWYCAFSNRTGEVIDMILLSRPGDFQKWLSFVFFLLKYVAYWGATNNYFHY